MSEEVQQRIIKKAGEMFFRFGIRSVTLDDICRELGISKKTLYVYYQGKDDLVEHLLHANVERMSAYWSSLLSDHPFDELVRSISKHIQTDQKDVRKVPQLVYDLQKYYPGQFADFQQKAFLEQKHYICLFLEKGLESGYVRNEINCEQTAVLMAKVHSDMVRDAEKLSVHGQNVLQLSCLSQDLLLRGVLSERGLALLQEKQ